jgi:hypothetical protein
MRHARFTATDIEVARGQYRTYEGGSVVISTMAPPEAIISIPGLEHDRFQAENEYLVDRRRLEVVEVAKRLSQKSVAA